MARDFLECAPCNPPLFASKPQEFLGRVATDTVLANDHAAYGDFLQTLWDRGMLITKTAIKVCGPFFVTKKDGSLRLILDTRDSNALFAEPPYTPLASAPRMAV